MGYDKDTLTYLAVQTIFFSSALSLCIFLSCRVRSLWPGWRFFVHLPKAKKHCDLDSHVQIIQINFARGWGGNGSVKLVGLAFEISA